jgi:hypothetical protein
LLLSFSVFAPAFKDSSSYLIVKLDEIVKSARSVISGLTRNPELIEITGFPLSRE